MAQEVLITPASSRIAFTDSGETTTVLRTSNGRFEFKDSGESNFVDIYANDIVLDGNLTVGGTTTTVNTSSVLIEDPILQLAKGQTSGTPTVDIGFLGLRGASNNAAFIWDESDDVFAAILTTGDGSATTLTPASYAGFKAGSATLNGALNLNNGSDNCFRIEADAGKDTYINSYGSGNFIQFKQNSAAVLSLYETFLAVPDSTQLRFGAGSDLRFYHDGNNSYIWQAGVGALNIKSSVTDGNIVFTADRGDGGGTFDYFSVNGGDTTYAGGVTTAYTKWPDNSRIALGGGKDLQLYHDGSNSYINEVGTGDLIIKGGNDIIFQDAVGNLLANMNQSNSVELYFGGSKKLETTSTGISVTGTGTFSGNATVNSSLTFSYNSHYFEAGTNSVHFKNGSGNSYLGISNTGLSVTGGVTATAANGFTAGTAYFYSASNIDRFGGNAATTRIYANSAQVLELTSSGLGVTGTGTFSGNVNLNGTDNLAGVLTASTYSNFKFQGANTSNYGPNIELNTPDGTLLQITRVGRRDGGTSNDVYLRTGLATALKLGTNNATYLSISATGTSTFSGSVGIVSGSGSGTLTGRLHIGSTTSTDNNSLVFWRGAKPSLNSHQGAILYENGGMSDGEGMTFMSDKGYKFLDDAGTTEWARITSSGKVGIGTAAPTSISASTKVLHLYGTNAELKSETNNNGGWAFSHYKSPQGSWTVGMGDSDKFRITNSDALTTNSSLVIDTSGNVGIGTNAPGYSLDIRQAGADIFLSSTTGTNRTGFQSANTGGVSYFYRESSSGGGAFSGTSPYATAVGGTGAYPLQLGTNNAVRMTIDSAGKVGIGVAGPSALLDVRDSGDANTKQHLINTGQTTAGRETEFIFGKDNGTNLSATLKYYYHTTQANRRIDLFHYGTTNGLSILNDGNVGIGTTAPSADLEVSTTSGGELLVTRSGNSGVTLQQVNGGAATSGSLAIKAGTAISFSTNGTNQGLYINNQTYPRVGIGTSSFRSIGGLSPQLLNIEGVNSQWDSGLAIVSNATGDYEAACLVLGRTGGTTVGSNTIVTDNDVLGRIIFTAADGVDMRATPAEIRSSVDDSSPAADAIAGNLEFYTNDGSGVAPTSRLIIAPDGEIRVAGQTLVDSANTNYNMTFPNMGGIAMGSAYTYANIYGSGGDLYLKANAYGANLGANPSRIYLVTAGNSGSTAPDVVVKGGQVGIGTAAPGAALDVAGISRIQSTGPTLRLYDTDHDVHSLQMDLSGGNFRFYKYTGSTNASHSEIFRVTTAGVVRFNNAFSFPAADGSANQVLQTNGSGTLSWSSAGTGTISGSGTDNYVPRFNGTGALQNSAIYSTDAGKVGIGTTAPYYDLDVRFTNNDTGFSTGDSGNWGGNGLRLQNLSTTVGSMALIQFRTSTAEWFIGNKFVSANDSDFIFNHENSEKVRFTSDGKVGIGTTSPSSLLHIYENDSAEGNTQLYIHNDKNDDAAVIKLEGKRTSANDTAQVIFANSGNVIAGIQGRTAGADDGLITFLTSAAGSGSAITERMRIDSAGRVGIGTTSPAQALHVAGGNLSTIRNNMFGITSNTPAAGGETNAYHNAYYDTTNSREEYLVADEACKIQFVNGQINFRTAAAGSADGAITWINAMGILADGKVGIGNTDPAAPLTVTADSGANAFALRARPNDDYSFIQFYNNAGSALRGQIYSKSTGDIGFTTGTDSSAGNDLYIKNGTGVGIGTTSPTTPLHVVGNTVINGVLFFGSTSGSFVSTDSSNLRLAGDNGVKLQTYSGGWQDRLTIIDNGKVGIGTTAPSTEGLEIVAPSADTSFNLNDQADSILVLRNSDSGSVNTGRFAAIQMKINSSSAAAEGTIRTQFSQDGGGDLIFSTTKNGSGVDRMAIDKDGDVKIYNGATLKVYRASNSAYAGLFMDTGERLYIRNSWGNKDIVMLRTGEVGIGTNAPAAKLDVRTTSGSGGSFDIQEAATAITSGYKALSLSNSNATAGNHIAINFADTVGGSSTAIISAKCNDHTNNYGDLQFWTRGATGYGTRLHIDQEGNVGIGTTAPTAKLFVKGSGGGAGLTFKTTDASNNETFFIGDGGRVGLHYYPLTIGIPSTTAAVSAARFQIEESGYFIVTNNAKVGIGTTAPTAKLEVSWDSGGFNATSVATQIASSMLAFEGNDDMRIIFHENGTTYRGMMGYEHAGSTYMGIWDNSSATNPTLVSQSGKIGIGTTSPGAPLHIKSSGTNGNVFYVEASDSSHLAGIYEESDGRGALNVRNAGGTATINLDSGNHSWFTSGNVGIGTTAPSTKFQVHSGDILITSGKQLISTNSYTQAPGGMLTIQGPSTGNTTLSSNQWGIVIGPQHTRSATAGTYYPGIAFNHLLNHSGGTSYNNAPQAWIGTRLYDTAGSERGSLVFATKSGTGVAASDVPIERMCINPFGNVGIGTTAPGAKLHVAGTGQVAKIGDNHWRGTNSVTVGTTYVTGVTVNLANHKSGYLKVIISGDWSGHSAIGYMSEYFIQKGSTTRYSQPGTVIREVTNQHNSDYITSQILDPTLNDGNADFAIQFKTNTGSVSCTVMYEFTGTANSVT